MDVLFFSISAGEGHTKAVKAISECIKQKYPDCRTSIIDTFKYISPLADKLIVGSYLNILKSNPNIYGKLYKMSEYHKHLISLSRKVTTLLSVKLENLIKSFNPSVIVCSHVFPLQMVSSLKQRGMVNVPLIALVTDFSNHSIWMHNNVDAYVVAHEYMKQEMKNLGIPKDIIYTYGIPVSNSFLIRSSKPQVLKTLGLDDKLTFLIMGGSLGLGNVEAIFKSLLESKKDLQVLAVTGRNTRLYEELKKYSYEIRNKARVLSYTNRISDLMDAADFIITKPGGMTVSEALIKELPILIISPIPGQEEKNARFLINSGAAARVFTDDNIDSIIRQIVDNPYRAKHMKEMARYLAKPNASRDIVNLLEVLTAGNPQLSAQN